MLLYRAAYPRKHIFERLSDIFAPVRRYQHEAAAARPFEARMRIAFLHGRFQRVDNGISRHIHIFRKALAEQILPTVFRRTEKI